MICGWLSPDGIFYSCIEYGHVNLAEQLVQQYYKKDRRSLPDEYLLERQWIKLYSDGIIAGTLRPDRMWKRKSPVTKEQMEWLLAQTLSCRQRNRLNLLLGEPDLPQGDC